MVRGLKLSVILLISAIILLSSALTCNAMPVYTTGTYFGGTGDEEFVGVKFAHDSTLVVAGNTSSDGSISGKAPVIIGSNGGTLASTGFVARYSSDGRSLLSYTRFEWGMCEIDGLLVDSTGIYVVGFANANYAGLIVGLGGVDTTGPTSGKKPFIAKLSTDGSKLIAGTYLAGSDTDRDELAIDRMSNGDIAVIHDNGNSDYLSRLSPDLKTQRWRVSFGTRAGSCRSQGLAVSRTDDSIYVTGYGMGNTTKEPLKGPFAYKFKGVDGTQEWLKSNGNYAIWNWSPKEGDGRLNGLISDSTGYEIAVDDKGNPLIAAYSDGGATVLAKDTNDWTKDAVNIDGDGYWGQSGASSISTIGRLNTATHQWIRAHVLNPHNVNPFNRIKGVCPMANDKVLWVGIGGNVPSVNGWYSTGNALIVKTKMDSTGTIRQFVTHVPNVDSFNACAKNSTGTRYAVVGYSKVDGAPCPGGVQKAFGGGASDGFLVVFDDDDMPTLKMILPDYQAEYKIQSDKSADIPMEAKISSGDEPQVSKVEFYSGSTLIGTATSNPYKIIWVNASAGSHTVYSKAYLKDGKVVNSNSITITIQKISGFCAKINWQPASSSLASGFVLFDNGLAYGNRGNGYSYGWGSDNTANVKDSNSTKSPDQSYDTYGNIPYKGKWEIAVPNGKYKVRLISGSATTTGRTCDIKAEGIVILHGDITADKCWLESTATVTVSDGFLTLTNGSTNSNPLCFIEITSDNSIN